jgi:hypothetical protein
MKNTHPYFLAAVLAVLGISIFVYKYVGLGLPLTPEESSQTWQVETRIAFRAGMGPTKIILQHPNNTGRFAIIDQNFVAPGYGLFTQVEDENRQSVFAIRDALGEQVLYASFVAHLVPRSTEYIAMEEAPPEATIRLVGAKLLAAQSVLDAAKSKSADTPTLVLAILARLQMAGSDDRVDVLLDNQNSQEQVARAAVDVLALAGVAARVVHGVRLVAGARNVHFIHWIEAYSDGFWRPYRPNAEQPGLPENYFPWWRGNAPFVQSNIMGKIDTLVTVARATETAGRSALVPLSFMERNLLEFSLFTLPLDVQQVFRVILMVPLGVMVLVVLRNLIGVVMFGTFMPVLIALSFRETTLLWGLFLFTIVVGAGLLVRVYLEYLKLLVVPRLACVLIVVIILMTFLSVLTHKLGVDRGLSVALFPLVIITMTIERMSIVWDENGPATALKQGLGSLMAASLCHFVMTISFLEHLFFVYPEILIVLLAVSILLGRYSGYRLMELWRFREFAKLAN